MNTDTYQEQELVGQVYYREKEGQVWGEWIPKIVLVAEPELETIVTRNDNGVIQDPMLVWFKYEHLPIHLQGTSKAFADLAEFIVATIPESTERTESLRKLLESKDAGVRASL